MKTSCRRIFYRVQRLFIASILFLFWNSTGLAQEPEAKIMALSGEVFISFQGDSPLPAVEGAVLLEGDTILTYEESEVRLALPDGSQVRVSDMTNLVMTRMSEGQEQKTSLVRLELPWGRFRAILSPLHQKPGSSFIVQTPNAFLTTTASALDVEIGYNPSTRTTFVLAHEFDVDVKNLVSGASRQIIQGHSAIITQGVIQEIARIITIPPATDPQQQTAQISGIQGEVFISLQGEKWTPLLEETVLQAGDAIQTDRDAQAVFKLSDGTTVAMTERTHLRLSGLTRVQQSGIRTMNIELLRGEFRTILGEEFRISESSCIIYTPNVRVAIQPARQMDTEIMYDPRGRITTVMAHKSSLKLLHLLTNVSIELRPGHSAIIRNQGIQHIARILRPLKQEEKK